MGVTAKAGQAGGTGVGSESCLPLRGIPGPSHLYKKVSPEQGLLLFWQVWVVGPQPPLTLLSGSNCPCCHGS